MSWQYGSMLIAKDQEIYLDSIVIGCSACQICQQEVGGPVDIVPVSQQEGVIHGLTAEVQGVEVLSIGQI